MEKQLTAQELACGYVQVKSSIVNGTTTDILNTTLSNEHGIYRVNTHEHGGRGRLFFEHFRTLTEARKAFKSQIKQHHVKSEKQKKLDEKLNWCTK